MSTIIVTDDVWQTSRPYMKKVIGLCLKSLTKKVNQLAKESDNPIVFVPDDIANRISISDLDRAEIHRYGREWISIVNRIDYKPLHEFADAIFRISCQAEPKSGLLHHGLSIFQILETHWINLLLHKFGFYVQMFSEVLQEKHVDRVEIISMRPEMKHLIMSLAEAKGISSIKEHFCLGGKFISLVQSFLLRSQEHSFDGLLKYFLTEVKKTPTKTTVYDQIKKPRVLFIGRMERTLRRLKAALPVLQSRIEFEPCLLVDMPGLDLAKKAVVEELQRSGLRCSWLSEWISASEAKKLLRASKKHLINGWHYIESKSQSDLTHNFLGLPIFPHTKRMLKNICLSGGLYASLLAEIISRVIAKCQPSLVVNFEEWEINRAVTLECKKYGIPSLAYYNLSPNNYTGLVRRLPEWMAVSGKVLYDDYLVNAKRDPAKLIIVGDTLNDKIKFSSKKKVRIKVCRIFGLSKEKKIIVVFAMHARIPWTTTDVENYYKKVFGAIKNLKDVQVIVKVHPQRSIEQVESLLRVLQCKADAITKNYDLLELSLAADLVCFASSTGGTFPMMVGTPAVTIQPRSMVEIIDELFGFVSGGGAVLVTEEEDATAVFRKLLYDPIARQEQIERARNFVTKHSGPLDGCSSQRLADLIVRIIQHGEI